MKKKNVHFTLQGTLKIPLDDTMYYNNIVIN